MEEMEQERIETLLKSLELVCELMKDDTIKNASNQQLVEYIELTNRLKAILLSSL